MPETRKFITMNKYITDIRQMARHSSCSQISNLMQRPGLLIKPNTELIQTMLSHYSAGTIGSQLPTL